MRGGSLEARAIASPRPFVRVGVVVPRYRHSAVDRNTVKRRLRELIRLELLPSLPPMDVVLRATPSAYARDFDALRDEVRRLGRTLSASASALPEPVPSTPPAPPGP